MYNFWNFMGIIIMTEIGVILFKLNRNSGVQERMITTIHDE